MVERLVARTCRRDGEPGGGLWLLPIPGANMAPALALCCFALGLIEQDDLAMAGGWFGTAATVVILILLYLFGTAIFAYLSNWLSP